MHGHNCDILCNLNWSINSQNSRIWRLVSEKCYCGGINWNDQCVIFLLLCMYTDSSIWHYKPLLLWLFKQQNLQKNQDWKNGNLYNKRRYVCLFVCLSVCSIWPERLGRSRPNLTQALISTQGVFLARSISRSLMYACGSDRKPGITAGKRHLTNDAHTTSGRLVQVTPSERLWNAVELRNEARRRKAPIAAPSSERHSREQNSIRRTGN